MINFEILVQQLYSLFFLLGNINICLMGDPGVAKSQLLSYIDRLAPRSASISLSHVTSCVLLNILSSKTFFPLSLAWSTIDLRCAALVKGILA